MDLRAPVGFIDENWGAPGCTIKSLTKKVSKITSCMSSSCGASWSRVTEEIQVRVARAIRPDRRYERFLGNAR
jgi:hypothetical protein